MFLEGISLPGRDFHITEEERHIMKIAYNNVFKPTLEQMEEDDRRLMESAQRFAESFYQQHGYTLAYDADKRHRAQRLQNEREGRY